jgi:hypothetical protein
MKVEGRMLTLWKPDGHESMRPFQEKEKAKDRDNRENSQYSHFIHLFSHNKVVISLKTHLASLQQFQIGNNTKKYPFQPATPASLDRFRQNFCGLLVVILAIYFISCVVVSTAFIPSIIEARPTLNWHPHPQEGCLYFPLIFTPNSRK